MKVICVKGAPSTVLPFCAPNIHRILDDNGEHVKGTVEDEFSAHWSQKVVDIASKGMRVLAFAYKVVPQEYEFSGDYTYVSVWS